MPFRLLRWRHLSDFWWAGGDPEWASSEELINYTGGGPTAKQVEGENVFDANQTITKYDNNVDLIFLSLKSRSWSYFKKVNIKLFKLVVNYCRIPKYHVLLLHKKLQTLVVCSNIIIIQNHLKFIGKSLGGATHVSYRIALGVIWIICQNFCACNQVILIVLTKVKY